MLLLALTLSSASAWNHGETVWRAERMPLRTCLEVHDGGPFTALELEDSLLGALEAWALASPCGTLSAVYVGDCSSAADVRVEVGPFGEPGTLALASHSREPEPLAIHGDRSYHGAIDATLSIDPTAHPMVRDAAIAAGTCTDETSLDRLLQHQLGHVIGLVHSCEAGETCTDAELRKAVMYWSSGPCVPAAIGLDDRRGLAWLYRPFGYPVGVPDAPLPLPARVCPTLETLEGAPFDPVGWSWGDGTHDGACHEYSEQGVFEVSAEVPADCDVDSSQAWGTIVACGQPVPERGAELIEVQVVGSLAVLEARLPIELDRCIEDVHWVVTQRDGPYASDTHRRRWSDELGPGRYDVAVHVQGIGGTLSEHTTFEVEGGCGCVTARVGGSAWMPWALVARRAGRRF